MDKFPSVQIGSEPTGPPTHYYDDKMLAMTSDDKMVDTFAGGILFSVSECTQLGRFTHEQ